MAKSFLFYDLETSGLNPRHDRIMQFAAIRTDMELNQVGEPINVMVKLAEDTLPSPEAIMVTGITPQQTQQDGYSEAEFASMLAEEVFIPDTTVVGFNNVRFDDEFIRYLFWRNFFDPYEWAYRDGRSRWDMLDVVRMTRALRPEGINWPVNEEGKASNRLEELAAKNGLEHTKAHDALSDVEALIGVAKLIKTKQPQLFDYLYKLRSKDEVKQLINLENKSPFVYVSGRLDSEYNKATVAFPLTSGKHGNVIVYDLRYDPKPLLELSQEDIQNRLFAGWEERQADGFEKMPTKELQYNRTPAVAPLGVLESNDGWNKLDISKSTVEKHKKTLLETPGFAERVRSAYEAAPEYATEEDAEAKLYNGFLNDNDRRLLDDVRRAGENELADLHPNFVDERLNELLLRYKARNFPKSLAEDEVVQWENWRAARVSKGLKPYVSKIGELSAVHAVDDSKMFLLQELQLWAETVLPADLEG
jgi:exodeoxyribonuclease-1